MFCNMARAYDTLTDKMKAVVGDLQSVYDFTLVSGVRTAPPKTRRSSTKSIHRSRIRPCGSTTKAGEGARCQRTHVAFQRHEPCRSTPIIQYLCEQATQPENVYRHQWARDLVWDNRTTMHLALGDFDPTARRRMLRATVREDREVLPPPES